MVDTCQATEHTPLEAKVSSASISKNRQARRSYPRKNMKTLSRDDVPLVILDTDATQKFAEIKVQWDGNDGEGETSVVLIRGVAAAEVHLDAAAPTMRLLRRAGVCATVTGGGRIVHDSSKRSIFAYGYSMKYGPADLAKVADLCREAFPDYDVTWSKGGY